MRAVPEKPVGPRAIRDAAGRRREPVQLPVAEGAIRLWPTEARALAVEAAPGAARRVLDAQRRGALRLSLVFDLPEDATCGSAPRG